MYHYIRDVARTPYPGIKARSKAEFARQLDFVEGAYTPVTCAQVGEAYRDGRPLPEDAVLLTFDDGLVDHRDTVAPELLRRGLPGCFAVPARPVLERRVLDVHKVHFLLAVSRDHAALATRILELAAPIQTEDLRARYAHPNRFDAAETVLVKRLLQDGLPEATRRRVLESVFAELVSPDEGAFADGLYLSLDDTRALAAAGFEIAGHGYEHRRLGLLDEAAQEEEIDRTRSFLGRVLGKQPVEWTMSYPYGDRNEATLRLLEAAGCKIAFTVEPAVAGTHADPLELPRLDTNDLPPERGRP